MSDAFRTGDTVELPVPYPQAWTDTMAYVYMGEDELLTELARCNILYLGGRA